MAKYTEQEKQQINTAKERLITLLENLQSTHKAEIFPEIPESEYQARVAKLQQQMKDALDDIKRNSPADDILNKFNRVNANVRVLMEDITGVKPNPNTMFSRAAKNMDTDPKQEQSLDTSARKRR